MPWRNGILQGPGVGLSGRRSSLLSLTRGDKPLIYNKLIKSPRPVGANLSPPRSPLSSGSGSAPSPKPPPKALNHCPPSRNDPRADTVSLLFKVNAPAPAAAPRSPPHRSLPSSPLSSGSGSAQSPKPPPKALNHCPSSRNDPRADTVSLLFKVNAPSPRGSPPLTAHSPAHPQTYNQANTPSAPKNSKVPKASSTYLYSTTRRCMARMDSAEKS